MYVVPEYEGLLAADDTGIFQFNGDATRGVSGTQKNNRLSGGLDWCEHGPGKPPAGSDDGDENEPGDLTHSLNSLDDSQRQGRALDGVSDFRTPGAAITLEGLSCVFLKT